MSTVSTTIQPNHASFTQATAASPEPSNLNLEVSDQDEDIDSSGITAAISKPEAETTTKSEEPKSETEKIFAQVCDGFNLFNVFCSSLLPIAAIFTKNKAVLDPLKSLSNGSAKLSWGVNSSYNVVNLFQ